MNLINQTELLGLGNLPSAAPAKRGVKAGMKAKTGAVSSKNATGKAMYERMLYMLPPEIQQGIRDGRLQLVDEILYSVKDVRNRRDLELMESGDNKEVGLTNVDKRKIEANKWCLLTGIQLLSGRNADPAKTTNFDVCKPQILNGEFELEVGNTVIVPNISCTVFGTKGRADALPGLWNDFDPQFIVPNTEIKPRLKLAAEMPATEQDTNIFFAMHVVSVAKN